MCLNPRIIENKRYKPSAANGGQAPVPTDYRLRGVEIPCGTCAECCRDLREEWKKRLNEEALGNEVGYGYFVTLSINEEAMDELIEAAGSEDAEAVARVAVRRFNERWRRMYKKSVKHWMVAELGQKSTERLHLHGILWVTRDQSKEIGERWGYGNVWVEKARGEMTVAYVVKYLTKPDRKHEGFRSRIYCSPGLGKNYLRSSRARRITYKGAETDLRYRDVKGRKSKMPRYYKRKMFTVEELEVVRLARMDDDEFYVCGRKLRGGRESRENMRLVKEIRAQARAQSWRDGYRGGRKQRYKCRGGEKMVRSDLLKSGWEDVGRWL